MLTASGVDSTARAPRTAAEIAARLADPEFWQDLSSESEFGDVAPFDGDAGQGPSTNDEVAPESSQSAWLDDLKRTGHCTWSSALPKATTDATLEVTRKLVASGWLPAFAFLFDVTWRLFRHPRVHRMLVATLGDQYLQLPYFYAWCVRRGQHGYRPHRECGRTGFTDPDGAPRALTLWIPLTDATVDNGCMSVVPRDLEIGAIPREQLMRDYGTDDLQKAASAALLHRARALPAARGSLLAWNHEILHWGGHAAANAASERISLACEYLRGDVDAYEHPHAIVRDRTGRERPFCIRSDGGLPSFQMRVEVLARSIVAFQLERNESAPFVEAALGVLERAKFEEST